MEPKQVERAGFRAEHARSRIECEESRVECEESRVERAGPQLERAESPIENFPFECVGSQVETPRVEELDASCVACFLPLEDPAANKYTRGKLTLVAGSRRYPGAALLAACAAQRMGAGYVEVVSDATVVEVVHASAPSLVARSYKDWRAGGIEVEASGKPQAVCVGPGFDADDPLMRDRVLDLLVRAACPVLVDGGALDALACAAAPLVLRRRAEAERTCIMTPHAGEAARLARAAGLLGMLGVLEPSATAGAPEDAPALEAAGAPEAPLTPAAPEDAPALLAATLARAYSCTVVLKGPDTFVSDGSRTAAMREGTAALAKAGTGDVLAGMISSLLAQGIAPFEASYTGALLHARAGGAAEGRFTSRGVRAEDVIEGIPAALRTLERAGRDE